MNEKSTYRWIPTKIELVFLLLSIYIGFLVVLAFTSSKSMLLDSNEPFLIGEATAYGVSIGKRVSMMYFSLIFGCIAAGISYFLLIKNVNRLSFFNEARFSILLGFLLVFGFIYLPDPFGSNTFLFLQLIFISEVILVYFKNTDYPLKTTSEKITLWLSIISISLLISNWWILIAIITLIFTLVIRLKQSKLVSILLLCTSLLPIIVLVAIEITLILNQRNIFLSSYLFIGIPLLIGMILTVYRSKFSSFSIEKQLYSFHIPTVLIAFSACMAYSPIQLFNPELFETANEMNPLMMTLVHGKAPLFDYMSSHLFSDFSFPFLYSVLNGYNGSQDPLIYKWLPSIISILITYYFLKSIIGNRTILVLLLFVLPFFNLLIPQTFGFALLPIYFLHRYFQTNKNSSIWKALFALIFVCFWRLDLAAALIPSFIMVGILCFIFKKETRKNLIKIALFSAIFAFAFLLVLNMHNAHLIKELLHYFGGNQAHGIHALSYFESNLFYVDYVLLPFLIVVTILLLTFNFRTWKEDSFYFPMLLLIGFYIFNLQRGLVRHTFVEMNETAITSFGWLILFLFVYRFIAFKKELVLFSGILFIGYFSSIHSSNSWKSIIDLDKKFSLLELPSLGKEKIKRTIPAEWREYDELLAFFQQNLKGKETFIDFSNTPMLYYYSQKEVPSLFSQYLQNTIDGYLQERNLQKIKGMDIPFVIFNHVPRTFFDNSDGIPNEVRYYRMTSHIYQNYKPYKVIGGFAIWVRKNSDFVSELDLKQDKEQWFLGEIPLKWKKEKTQKGFKFKKSLDINRKGFTTLNSASSNFIQIKISSTKDVNHILKGRILGEELIEWHFSVKKGIHNYTFPIGCSKLAFSHSEIEWMIDLGSEKQLISAKIVELK